MPHSLNTLSIFTSSVTGLQIHQQLTINASSTVGGQCRLSSPLEMVTLPRFHKRIDAFDAAPFAVPAASLWSDNATYGWDRQQFLNNPIDQWPAAAANKWGKFNSSRGPLICWEPSSQADVQNVYKTFAASGADHADGVLIASNTDPAMFQVRHAQLASNPCEHVTSFQVYAAAQSLAAINSPLPAQNSSSSGRVRVATAAPLVSLAQSTPKAESSLSASRFTVVCTLSGGPSSTVINYVSGSSVLVAVFGAPIWCDLV